MRGSVAALLHELLLLRGVPRNKNNPERFANFGLEGDADGWLTAWMHDRLTLSVWPMPCSLPLSDLEAVEKDVIRAWTPPLNMRDNPGRLRWLRIPRAAMASEAKAWVESNVKLPGARDPLNCKALFRVGY